MVQGKPANAAGGEADALLDNAAPAEPTNRDNGVSEVQPGRLNNAPGNNQGHAGFTSGAERRKEAEIAKAFAVGEHYSEAIAELRRNAPNIRYY